MAIPFEFFIGTETLKPGDYVITLICDKQIALRGTHSQTAVMVLTNPIDGGADSAAPRLVFHKYGSRYFLTQIWLHTSDAGRELYVSPEEISMAREYRQERVFLVPKK
jgi:hypothetical protein